MWTKIWHNVKIIPENGYYYLEVRTEDVLRLQERRWTDEERRLFAEGRLTEGFELFGAHPAAVEGCYGHRFTVWAPGARSVRVTGSFCDWDPGRYPMEERDGIWSLFVPGTEEGELYKFVVETAAGELLYKADPYACCAQRPPETASRLYDLEGYRWRDGLWLARRARTRHLRRPLNIYEVHLGSWRRHEDGGYYSYRELAETLVPYAVEMGYTHLELMPVMEHPFDGSWGYQITGYFAPTSRYGEPKDFMYFVDCCHRAGLGVILDWVPGHFCRDAHGLAAFTGERLYEKEGHPNWGTLKFDLERGEVRSFLRSNLCFWLSKYHIDGVRVDGVTSMLYLNFGVDDPARKKYNERGTEEDLVAIEFLKELNRAVGTAHPDVLLIAEESTAWPLVTYPPEDGGLGFHYKWDMGWMHDTLHYMQTDFPFRPGNHNLLTFSMMYAFDENFVLALSHDEVVHGKCSLIGRMPGDYWRQFAGLRLLALYQICHPGAKLNFMGNEIGQFVEWRYGEGLEWFLLDYETHRKHQAYCKALNALYRSERGLFERGYSWEGFQWLDADNAAQSTLLFLRRGERPIDELVVLLNFAPETCDEYRIGVPRKGSYRELLNSDAGAFGGSGRENPGELVSEPVPCHGMAHSVVLRTPPVGGLILKRVGHKSGSAGRTERVKQKEDICSETEKNS